MSLRRGSRWQSLRAVRSEESVAWQSVLYGIHTVRVLLAGKGAGLGPLKKEWDMQKVSVCIRLL